MNKETLKRAKEVEEHIDTLSRILSYMPDGNDIDAICCNTNIAIGDLRTINEPQVKDFLRVNALTIWKNVELIKKQLEEELKSL